MFVETNGIRLFYETAGCGSPVLLLHGNGEDHTIFQELSKTLSQNYTIYSIDSQGHGQSSPAQNFDYVQMADDIVGAIQTLHIPSPALFGFSDGGIIGLLIAIRYPGLLSRLIACGANTSPSGLQRKSRRYYKREYRRTGNALLEMVVRQPHIRSRELSRIQIPVLILAGEKDMIRRRHTRAIARHIPGSQIKILQGEDHGSYIVHTNKTANIIEEFFANTILQSPSNG